MAVDFGILAQTPTIGARYAEGLQAAQAERDRNMLRQQQAAQIAMQQENMLAQQGEREAQAALRGQQSLELKSRMERAARDEKLLTGLGNLLRQNGYKMDRPTLGYMAEVSMQTGDAAGAKLAMEGLRALDDREALQAAFGGQAAPAAAPSMMRQAPAAAAPAAPTNMFAGTMADIGTTQPAPVNALATPPQAPAAPTGGVPSADRLRAIIADPASPKVVVDRAKAVLASLPKDQPGARLQDRFVPVGKLVFDRQEQKYITPPQAAIAATQDRPVPAGARQKAPSGYRFTPSGDLEPIPGGPATRATESKPLTPQQETQRRDKLGKEFKSAVNALQTTQDVLDSLQNVKDAPGLDRATGYFGVYAPSIPEGAAAQAETRFQNLKGKVTALGKAQAAASGAIGSIANQEWKILADQIAALELVKGTGPLLEQLDLVEAQARGAMERIRDAYQRQFGEDFERFPQFKDLPAPKSTIKSRKSGGPVTPATPATPATPLTAAEQAELDALRQRFGGRRP